jgi:hypothetical protein
MVHATGAGMKRIPWIIFGLMLLFAILYVTRTVGDLPPLVASHFDAGGRPNAYMTRSLYTKFALGMSVGLPIAMVALLTVVYSNAKDMKLPNRDYWLAPERIAQTHWLELGAHRSAPPHLSNQLIGAGLIVFLLITIGWIVALLSAFRRPRA